MDQDSNNIKLDEFRKSETRYRILFEEAGDGIFIMEKGRIIDCNQKALTLFKCEMDHLIGKTPFDFSPKMQPNGINSRLQSMQYILAAQSGQTQVFEWQHLRPDGSTFSAEVSLTLITLPSTRLVQAIMRDITLRKQALEELKELKDRLEKENIYLQEEIRTNHGFEEIIGESQALKASISSVEKVAQTDSTVLILGQTGTGKELIARAIHSVSRRKDRPLVKVNCAAIPATLVESELFGHEKGAFTGATDQRIGRFELAHGGTIFLDEIGELPLELQGKLLRVLQDGEFERVGGTRTIRADVRVIGATNRSLSKMLDTGSFREDLFYRLNVFPIKLPPLRERREDIPLLARHFVLKHAARCGKKIETIPHGTMKALQDYSWPGNIRELENIIERGLIISSGSRLDLGDWLYKKSTPASRNGLLRMEDVERAHIQDVLKMTKGRVSGENGAAQILGLNPQTLYSRIKRLGVNREG